MTERSWNICVVMWPGRREDTELPEGKGSESEFSNHPATTTLAANLGPGTGGLISKTTNIWTMRPQGLQGSVRTIKAWVDAFNRADAESLADLYDENAINHQVAETPVSGRAAIHAMFSAEFAHAKMVCIVENVFEDGEWAILEWKDPLGLRGCGFFHVVNGKIMFQRGYWDKLSFLRMHGLPIPQQ